LGIPQQVKDLTYTFTFNDIESVRQSIDDDTAAIILEPMVVDEPNETFLHDLRELCTQRGIVLIFDEMWTGFRIARGGAQERFGVVADLVCYSKAIANGMPLSVLAGKADIMRLLDKDVFFFTTFGGEALSLAAARATMQVLRDEPVLATIEQQGNILRDQLNAMIGSIGIDWLSTKGLGSRTMLAIARPMEEALLVKSYIHQELLRCGILWNGFHNLSYAHRSEDIEHTLEAYSDVLPRLQDHMLHGKLADQLLGTPMEPVFRRTGNFNTKPRLGVSA
jgi:glutamate-1-semialdehyde aminotransferase